MTREEKLELAGEYVLGLLDDADRMRAERALKNDVDFRKTVEAFTVHMSRLDLTAVPEAVPKEMWDRIAVEIDRASTEETLSQPIIPAFNRRFHLRQFAAAASVLIALGLGYLGGRLISTAEPEVVIVLLTPDDVPGAVFEAYADNAVRVLPLQDFPVPSGKVMQVWTLYDKAVGPVSLGTLQSSKGTVLAARELPIPADNQLYEITLEPAPASPTGKPTGPILVKGFAKRPPS